MLRHLAISPKISFYTTLCFAFLTIFFVYGTNNYEGNLNTLFLLSSIYFLFLFQKKNRFIFLVLAASFIGLALNTRIELSIIFLFGIICVALYYSVNKKSPSIAIVFFLSLLPFIFLWGWYNWIRTGSFFLTPFVRMSKMNFCPNPPEQDLWLGIRSLFLSRGGSIFLFSPILLITIFGWKDFFEKKGDQGLILFFLILIFVIPIAKLKEWFGLSCWGPRYTLDITPLMMVPLAFWLSKNPLKNKLKKIIFIVVVVWSFIIQLSGNLTNWHNRLGYLLSKGRESFFYTITGSQWWDSARVLITNIWNLFFGYRPYLNITGYDLTMSSASFYTSVTLHTWWNRLIYLGVPIFWISIYLWLSFVTVAYLLISIRNDLG